MALPIIHPIALDTLAVLLVAPLTESLSIDEQGVVGAFLSVLGDLLSLNSSYLSYIQPSQDDNEETNQNDSDSSNQDDEYELIKKSLDKMKEELEKLKQEQLK